ncbi:alpha/beta fold hydrolase [Croceitalea marina]|uniref:Alpha/beta fold hydrolase n=1 Tax=Croceitalea marina TaxID=1775166 RepID=A0ABW5N3L5_9FLAO
MKNKIFLFLFILMVLSRANAQMDIDLQNFEGLYMDSQGEKYLLSPRAGFPHFVILKSGETHMLRKISKNQYEFSNTRNNFSKVGGFIELTKSNIITLSFNKGSKRLLAPIPIKKTELGINLNDSLYISGSLIQSAQTQKNKIAVLLHGDGQNDRYDLFDLGMYLIDSGYSIFAFDKRNVGKSRGKKILGNNYLDFSKEYANDATQIVKWLQKKYPHKQLGVIGISQGGWIGAMVAQEVPNLGFYVNIAGNMSIGWQQFRHYMFSYLKRNGFSKADLVEATNYFKAYFDLCLNKIEFEEYEKVLPLYINKVWFKKLETRKLVKFKSKKTALRLQEENSFDPTDFLKDVYAPSLGIFYQYDHSTPPDSPARFMNGLINSKSKDISVRVFPNTTHGGWVVDGYYFNSNDITRMESKAFFHIIEWLKSL